MQDIPKSLQYKSSMPQGFPSAIKTVTFEPISGKGYWTVKDKVRFEIRANGFLDPYTTRLNFDVECTDLEPDEIRRLDGSAHSFFNELVIQSKGVVIERLPEYDTVAQILHDVNWNANDRRIKLNEGHGISELSCGEFSNMQNCWFNNQNIRGVSSNNGYDPTDSGHMTHVGPQGMVGNQDLTTDYYDGVSSQNASSTYNPATNDGTGLISSPYLSLFTSGLSMESLTHLQATNSDAVVGSMGGLGQVPFRGSGPLKVVVKTQIGTDLELWQQSASLNQKLSFVKNKTRWVFDNSDLINYDSTWSGMPKTIEKFDASNIGLWSALSQTSNSFTGTLYDNPRIKERHLRQLIQGGTQIIGSYNLSLFNQNFPTYFVNGANNLEINWKRMMYDTELFNQYGDSQSLAHFVGNGYFSTNPWTLTERNMHEVFEPAPDYRSQRVFAQRAQKRKYIEAGGLQQVDVIYHSEGYQQPYNPLYATSTDEPYFAGTDIQVKRLYNGTVINQNGRQFLSFSIPLLSALFGVLVPQELYKFIPMNVFEDLVIELECNPYALFSSGYKSNIKTGDRYRNEVFDIRGKNSDSFYQQRQNSRDYRIIKMQMIGDLMSFTPQIEKLVNDQWTSEQGLIFQTYFWALGPQYTFNSTSSVGGSHQINLNFNSLKSVIWRFYPLDYERWSFCRKHYAISHNLKSFKFALGQDFLPVDGVKGNAGTPFGVASERDGSNKEFFNFMLDNFNKLHDVRGNMLINPYNFSINDRCYNPEAKGAYYHPVVKGQTTKSSHDCYLLNQENYLNNISGLACVPTNISNIDFTQTTLVVNNASTALQLPGFHETRVVGKCLYAYNTETLTNEFQVLSGLNTYDFKPFNVVFEVDNKTEYHFKRDSRLFMFFHYDAVVVMKSGMSPQVVGRS